MEKKYISLIGGAIVLALVFAVAFFNKTPKYTYNPASDMPKVEQPAPAANTDSVNTPTSKKLSYGEAIKAYPYRFQLVQCQTTPAIISVKKGAVVMFDNRDSNTHTVKAGGPSFKIAGYDYALLHTYSVGEFDVVCDGANRAVLNVEK